MLYWGNIKLGNLRGLSDNNNPKHKAQKRGRKYITQLPFGDRK